MIRTEGYLRFERVDGVEETATGVRARLHGEVLEVDVVRADVVRLRISRGGRFDEHPTYAVEVDPLSEPAPFGVELAGDAARLRTEALVVTVGLDPFRIDVHRSDGTAVVETAVDGEGRPWAYATLNDAFVVRRRCQGADAFYGLGEKTGRHNRRGRDFTLWNTDVISDDSTAEFRAGRSPDDPRSDQRSTEFDPYYVSIPFLYHHDLTTGAMAGSFVDNGYRATYDLTGREEYSFHFSGGHYVEYVFAGPRMPAILEAYTWLTGRMSLPPLWSLGYHQCRWHTYTQHDVAALARRFRELDLPCDVLWLDIEYMDGYRVFTWHPERFPDPDALLRDLDDLGFRMITIVDPGVKREPGYWVYDQAVERDVLCRTEGGDLYTGQVWPGETAFPDFVREEARAWWGELNADHVRSGIAGIWNDMNEPATGVIDPHAMRFDGGRESHARRHNSYALLMAMGTVDGLRAALPDQRPFVLTRAGSAGIQRYAAHWTGDNQSRWDHLRLSVAMVAGLGVSGQPFAGSDIGGFQGDSSPELFLRWMQYGVLTPFCRNHSEIANVDQYPWSWGETILGHVRDALRLRYRLLPYLYAAFCEAHETGAPVQRPLVYAHQDDPVVADLDDEYLLGRDLLVAPVLEPGQTARQVYLPEGEWLDWHTGERHAGRSFLLVGTPMDRIPVFVRAGAVVPMWGDVPASTAGHHPDLVELHVHVPSEDARETSVLCEDDGLTVAAEHGARLRTTVTLTRRGSSVELRGDVDGDGFPELARRTLRLVLHGAAPERVVVDGRPTRVTGGRVELANAGEPFLVTFED